MYFLEVNMKACFIINLALTVILANAQNTNINCNFVFYGNQYTCDLVGVIVADNEQANFIIGGQHFSGHGNNDVRRLRIIFSNIPFIITQLFTTFPNINAIFIWRAGLRRIQPNAFINTRGVVEFGMSNNPIEDINENAFNGLFEVRRMFLEYNQIRQLHFSSFQNMPLLEWLHCRGNQLETLDGRLIANNQLLVQIRFDGNQIIGIQRSFLDNQPSLSWLDLRGNRCIDRQWWLTGGNAVSIDSIRQELDTCFNNFEQELRKFIVTVQGSVRILYENGTVILPLTKL